jgi:hypothetical protein
VRTLFKLVLGLSLSLTLITGVAFAWSSTLTWNGLASQVGTPSAAITDQTTTGATIYPTGDPIVVANADLTNTTPAGWSIQPVSSSVTMTAGCGAIDGVSGDLNFSSAAPIAPLATGDAFAVRLTMAPNATCAPNTVVSYDVAVNVQTP